MRPFSQNVGGKVALQFFSSTLRQLRANEELCLWHPSFVGSHICGRDSSLPDLESAWNSTTDESNYFGLFFIVYLYLFALLFYWYVYIYIYIYFHIFPHIFMFGHHITFVQKLIA